MVPTSVLLTAVLAAFAVLGGAFWALAARIGTQVDRTGDRVEAIGADLGRRIETLDARLTGSIEAMDARLNGQIAALDTRLTHRIEAVDGKVDALGDQMTAVRAALAGLDSRVATIERHSGLD